MGALVDLFQPRTPPRILILDIETAPNLAWVWSLFDRGGVPLQRLVQSQRMICFGAKWLGDAETFVWSERGGSEDMLQASHELVSAADAVVTYNGNRFDLPRLRAEWLRAGLPPTPPVQSIDLYREMKRLFSFASGKLDHVLQELGIGEKLHHTGFDMWTGCMAGDVGSWELMEAYNAQDVEILEPLLLRVAPWIKGLPNLGLFDGDDCPRCGGRTVPAGVYRTGLRTYPRRRCERCRGWSRGGRSIGSADLRAV